MKRKHQMCFLVVFLIGCTAANPTPLPPDTPTIGSPGHDVYISFEGHHGPERAEVEFPLHKGKNWTTSVGVGWIAEFTVVEFRDEVATIEIRDGSSLIGKCTYRSGHKEANCTY